MYNIYCRAYQGLERQKVFEKLARLQEEWHTKTDYAIMATSAVSGVVFENCQYLCGTENFIIAMYEDEKYVDTLVDKLTELNTEMHLHYLKDVGGYCEWVEFTEDFASQNGKAHAALCKGYGFGHAEAGIWRPGLFPWRD